MATGIYTLYMAIGDFSRVRKAFIEILANVTKEIAVNEMNGSEDKLSLRLQDDSTFEVNVKYGEDFINAQIPGMRNFFANAPCENKNLHESVLQQISIFNCIVGIQYEETENEERDNFLVQSIFMAAKQLNAVVLHPSMRLYTSDIELILSIDGITSLSSYTPISNADLFDKDKEESASDTARREKNNEILASKNIPFMEKLPVIQTEKNASMRTAEQIARRLFAMFAVCVYCEVISQQGKENTEKYLNRIDELMQGTLESNLTPAELQFLGLDNPTPQEIAHFGWRYECCYVLMWALGYVKSIGYPENLCDVSELAGIIWNCESLESFLKNVALIGKDELLDEADLILRYHWACVDNRIKGMQAPANLNEEVVYEWHYVMLWLINENEEWDYIQTNT